MYLLLATGFLLAIVTSLALVTPLKALALRFGWVDRPDALRKHHAKTTPYLGGVAIAVGFAVGLGYIVFAGGPLGEALAGKPAVFWLGGVAMLLTGLYDDARGLGFKKKLLVQAIVAYGLLHAGYRLDLTGLPFVPADAFDQALYSIPLTLLWIVGVINAVNLIDGMDGLAGGVAAIAFASLALVFGLQGNLVMVALAVPMVGALVGFLRYNFNPASIFMGDAGSLFLGYMLATFALEGRAHADPWLALLIPVFALALPLVDTGFAIIRRVAMKRAICAPDADHIHHRLKRRLSVPFAVLTLYATSLLFGLGAVAISMSTAGVGLSMALVLAGCIPLGLALLGYDLRPSAIRAANVASAEESTSAPAPAAVKPTPAVAPVRADRPQASTGEHRVPQTDYLDLHTGPLAIGPRRN